MTDELKAMRVLLLTDNMMLGGVQQVVAQLARALAERNVNVSVAASEEGALWSRLPEGISRHYLPPRSGVLGSWGLICWLRNIARTEQIDIVHAHQRGVALAARFALLGTSTRVVEHVHNTFTRDRLKIFSFRGHQLIACGSSIVTMLVDEFGRAPSQVTLIPNSVEDLAIHGSVALPSGRDLAAPISIVGIGRLSPQKDPTRFVDVIGAVSTLLAAHGRTVQGVWFGEGELLAAASEHARNSGVLNVEFAGTTDDIAGALASADVLFMTSRWEGLPLVLIEAASMGRGAIVPDVGSCRDIVSEGLNGDVYPVDMPNGQLAERMARQLTADTLGSWSSAARLVYEERFRPERFVSATVDVYRRALQGVKE